MIKFKRLPIVYVASPYSPKGYPPSMHQTIMNKRAKQIDTIIGKLQDRYDMAFIGPITQSHRTAKHMDTPSELFAAWRDIDLTYISICNELWVATMEGWDRSTGVLSEIDYANERGIPIRYINPETLKLTKEVKKYV